ncbi:NADP-dependent oxidoreductase [Paenibacillus nanensis]|uniref:NADP-dependent oxidoreductase n=1 Tax=Paenibacillus nanensis TaxID=393251 RepID=A0A3A1VPK4_9BACL|nr:NADP-dependent oxidoreductase [Paenibacillus nanensis]RIX59380.1 NADP-dependent oxidoreductase [Paenibacillus nanensis]
MNQMSVKRMKAAALQRFGGPEELKLQEVNIPHVGPNDVLIRLAYAGVGVWDAFERQGGYAKMLGLNVQFPYILGSEGSGTVCGAGDNVTHVKAGDLVYAPAFLNSKGGFYAEYAVVDAQYVTRIPDGLTMEEAAVISGIGITALRGLEDVLKLRPSESILIFGAGGGIGHIAAQLAKSMGARVFGVASGDDGVAMAKKLGCDEAVDGRDEGFASAAMQFAPNGFDAALFTAGGEAANIAAGCIRAGGRAAFPNGIHPEVLIPPGVEASGYNGDPDSDIIRRLHSRIIRNRLSVFISHTFSLEEARIAHETLNQHYIGKICLTINP